MRYIFFGSPTFSAVVLRALIDAGMPPTALVCNPDRPVGRKKISTPPATKQLILERGLPIKVFQPKDKKELAAISPTLLKIADFAVVVAYALIISIDLIRSFRLGALGIHPSLLPKYRGASPIQSAILAGEKETGTTLFMLDSEMDHGPVLDSKKVAGADKYYEVLANDLAIASADLLVKGLRDFADGKLIPHEQNHSFATATKKFETEDAYVDPADLELAKNGNLEKVNEVYRKIRALNPEPGAFTVIDGKRTKLLRARIDGDKLILERIQKEGKSPVDL